MALPWTMHGRDLAPLLSSPERTDWSHPLLFEHTGHDFGSDVTKVLTENGKAEHNNVPWWLAVRDGKHKYIRYLKAGEIEELYDLDADPEELTNLGMRSEHRALVERLRGVMRDELRRTGANFIEALPATANR